MHAASCAHVWKALTCWLFPNEKHTAELLKHRLTSRFSKYSDKTSLVATKCSHCTENRPNVWACLSCNYQGCGRNQNKHAGLHYQENPDHCICINLDNSLLWCYNCDKQLLLTPEENLKTLKDDKARLLYYLLYNVVDFLTPPLECDSSDNGSTDSAEEEVITKKPRPYDWEEAREVVRSATELLQTLYPAGSLPRGLCGLKNIGNTCYMNSGLQCLSNTSPLRQIFLGPLSLQRSANNATQIQHILIDEFGRLMDAMWCGNRNMVVPQRLHQVIGFLNPTFRGYAQHDSQELLRTLLDALHEALKRDDYSNSQDVKITAQPSSCASTSDSKTRSDIKRSAVVESPISNIFEGKLLSTVTCGNCRRTSQTLDRFLDLSLSIPSSASLESKIGDRRARIASRKNGIDLDLVDRPSTSDIISESDIATDPSSKPWYSRLFSWISGSDQVELESCLHGFCVADELTGNDRYKCEHCKALHDATKSLAIAQLPQVLCLHIKRFRYDFFGSKVGDYVKFPMKGLNLADFCETPTPPSPSENVNGNCLSNGTHHANGTHNKPEHITDKTSILFDLFAVICHSGSFHGGHYYTYAKNAATGRWYLFNDSEVEEVEESTVQQAEAYVLFYEQQTTASKLKEREEIKSSIAKHLASFQKQAEEGKLEQPFPTPQTVCVSLSWLTKWLSINHPGPMNAPGLTCPHNMPLPLVDPMDVIPIPPDVASHFISTYGGEVFRIATDKCTDCVRLELEAEKEKELEKQRLETRRAAETEAIRAYSRLLNDPNERAKGYYFIEVGWVTKWQAFVNGTCAKPPGPIDNRPLLNALNSQKHKWRAVNDTVWRYLFGIYGGGPELWDKNATRPSFAVNAAAARRNDSGSDYSSDGSSSDEN